MTKQVTMIANTHLLRRIAAYPPSPVMEGFSLVTTTVIDRRDAVPPGGKERVTSRLSVKQGLSAAVANGSNRIALQRSQPPCINHLTCSNDLHQPSCH